MDLQFTPEEQAFQQEVREWFKTAVPEEMRGGTARESRTSREGVIKWHKILHEKGWIAPDWPVEYGGTGWTATQKYIFQLERAMAGAPAPLPFGLKMVGPVIYTFGNEEQKKRFLPGILNGDNWWCQGYSEPGSGSDLASLKMSAVRDGDHYVCNGTKIWTTMAHHADWIFCLVRTGKFDKKQDGISFLLIDMNDPGIKVDPIITIDGGHSVNQVFFTDVRVPAENLIGEENKGWTYAKFLLVNERNGIADVGGKKQLIGKIKALADKTDVDGGPLSQTDEFKQTMAEAEINLRALEYSELRYLSGQHAPAAPGGEASHLKVKATELEQRLTEIYIDAAGYYALPFGQGDAPFGSNQPPVGPEDAMGSMELYNWMRVTSIYGGSNEIQRDIIAKLMVG